MKKFLSIMLAVILFANIFTIQSTPDSVQAATNQYVLIDSKYPVKIGNYYYKITESGKLKRSKSSTKNFKTMFRKSNTSSFLTNGKKVYYIAYSEKAPTALYQCSIKGKNKKKIKNLPDSYYSYHLSAFYNNKIYFASGTETDGFTTYTVNASGKGAVKKEKKSLYILSSYKQYMVGYSVQSSDVSDSSLCLYNAKTKKKTSLGLGSAPRFFGNKIYYARYNSAKDTYYIKSCNCDGSDKKSIAKIPNGFAHIHYVGASYCYYSQFVSDIFQELKYVYKTQKTTKVK